MLGAGTIFVLVREVKGLKEGKEGRGSEEGTVDDFFFPSYFQEGDYSTGSLAYFAFRITCGQYF